MKKFNGYGQYLGELRPRMKTAPAGKHSASQEFCGTFVMRALEIEMAGQLAWKFLNVFELDAPNKKEICWSDSDSISEQALLTGRNPDPGVCQMLAFLMP